MSPTTSGAESRCETIHFRVSPHDMATFASLSGDDNPVHADADFAAARGFPEPVVYGGLLVAQISRLLGARLPGHGCVWRSLALKFRNPLHVGQPAELTGTVRHVNGELGLYLIGLRIEAGGRLIAEGEAQASLPAVRGMA